MLSFSIVVSSGYNFGLFIMPHKRTGEHDIIITHERMWKMVSNNTRQCWSMLVYYDGGSPLPLLAECNPATRMTSVMVGYCQYWLVSGLATIRVFYYRGVCFIVPELL